MSDIYNRVSAVKVTQSTAFEDSIEDSIVYIQRIDMF